MSTRLSSGTLVGARPPSSSGQRAATKNLKGPTRGGMDLLSREEEYMRLNAELEAKTATLIQEAEEVMREQDSILNHSFDRLDLRDSTSDAVETPVPIYETEPSPSSDSAPKPPLSNSDKKPGSKGRPDSARSRGRSSTAGSRSRPNTAGSRGASARASSRNKRKPKGTVSSGAPVSDDVAIPSQGMDSFNLGDTISSIERRLEDGDIDDDAAGMDDILPQAAEGMGAEATIRFLKAKLRVMQEELDNVSQECNQRAEANSKLETRVKELEEDKGRLNRGHQTQLNQIDKYKKLADDAKRKNDGLETQLVGLRKELESLKRSTKSSASTHSATEVRLNRALEEIEKYKSELQRAKLSSRESTETDKKRTEQLQAENRRLEKQKNELMTGFKKQLKLIDILKKQKMHIEAAKLLSFTEEEFVKALEWGSG